MKKITLLIAVLTISCIAMTGCKKASKEGTPEKDSAASAKEISIDLAKPLSTNLCKKMIECTPESSEAKMTMEQCMSQLGPSLSMLFKEKKLKVSKADVDKCIESIKTGTCENVMGTEPPKGCEFLN